MLSKVSRNITGLQRQCFSIAEKQRQCLFLTARNKAIAASASNSEPQVFKSYSEVPGPSGFFQVLSNFIDATRNFGKGHLLLQQKFAKYGPVYKENFGIVSFLQICDVNDIEHMLRNDSKHPKRIAVDSWIKWRENANEAKGIIIQNDGPEWKRMRVQLDKRMLRPRHVAAYTDDFNKVITDFTTRLSRVRDTKGDGVRVPGLDMELFLWSLETIGTVIYERRFGGFEDDKDPEIVEFIHAVQDVFRTTEKLFAFPFWLAKYIAPSAYKGHVNAWRTIFGTGKKFIDEKTKEIQAKLDNDEEVEGFLSTLWASKSLSQSEVYANISELMMGAVDTTSNTMQWVIYELARNPDIQEKLRQEVMEVSKGEIVDHDALQKMPYLKGVIKEALRLYPVAGVVTRTIQEDLVLAGYKIPEGTLIIGSVYMTGRDPTIFEDPLAFRPERWLRSGKGSEKLHNFAWLPFGFGPRMCIGRRVAELEMHLLTARLMQKFRFEPVNDEVLNAVTRGLFVPEKSVDVKIFDI